MRSIMRPSERRLRFHALFSGAPILAFLLALACSDPAFTEKTASDTAPRQSGDVLGGPHSIPGMGDAGFPRLPDGNGDGLPDFPQSAAVKQLQAACKAQEPGTPALPLATVTRTLSYPERKNCSWKVPPNLDRRDAFHQAHEISAGQLELPPGVICNMNIRSKPNAQLHYDDFLILTLANQAIFVSNRMLAARLEAQSAIYNWSFERIVGQPIGNFEAPPYCLGPPGRCTLPGHDQKGPVKINLTSLEIGPIALALAESQSPSVAMDLIATGDNDDEDCFHSALELEVEFQYLPR